MINANVDEDRDSFLNGKDREQKLAEAETEIKAYREALESCKTLLSRMATCDDSMLKSYRSIAALALQRIERVLAK